MEPETGCLRQTLDDRAELVMRVAEKLCDRQHAARLKGTMTLAQGSGTIRDFSEGIAEENQIETCFGDVRLSTVSEDRFQIGNASSFYPNLEPLDHARLNVDPHRISAW